MFWQQIYHNILDKQCKLKVQDTTSKTQLPYKPTRKKPERNPTFQDNYPTQPPKQNIFRRKSCCCEECGQLTKLEQRTNYHQEINELRRRRLGLKVIEHFHQHSHRGNNNTSMLNINQDDKANRQKTQQSAIVSPLKPELKQQRRIMSSVFIYARRPKIKNYEPLSLTLSNKIKGYGSIHTNLNSPESQLPLSARPHSDGMKYRVQKQFRFSCDLSPYCTSRENTFHSNRPTTQNTIRPSTSMTKVKRNNFRIK